MRLTLDELKVAEVAARNYPVGGTDWYANGKPCCAQGIHLYRRNGFGDEWEIMQDISQLWFVAAGWAKLGEPEWVPEAIRNIHGMFIAALQAGPMFVADTFAMIIRCAEMTANYKPAPVKYETANFFKNATSETPSPPSTAAIAQDCGSGLTLT